MSALLRYVLLPREVTPFERKYLEKTNRIALAFFALHLPAFVLLAWANGTQPLVALALTSAVLAGPTFAYFTLRQPRVVSMIYGVTAMAMGGLLVHFGQGPMQIEMHFYFFALIAMLALFGNPMVIVAAAVTVALHHLLLWFVLPASVFNYEAPVWVVAVHAAFVVLESIGAVYIARSFFENVIGLESVIVERTAEIRKREADMRLVLDNVEQGFVTIDRTGRMAQERSACLDRWFGREDDANATVFDMFAKKSPSFAENARASFDQIADDILPLELLLDQMPKQLEADGRVHEVTLRPIGDDPLPQRFLVVVVDVTAARAAERADTERREAMYVLERVMTDRAAVLEFFSEANTLVTRICEGADANDLVVLKRNVHTLKGNAALFGFHSVARQCHALEDWISAEAMPPRPADLEALAARWSRLSSDMDRLLGSRRTTIEIDEIAHAELERAVRRDVPRASLLRMVHDLRLEPAQRRLETFGAQARRIATQLDKQVDVIVDGGGLSLDPRHWSPFWAAFVHAVRNTVDHGVEPPAEREALGKPVVARVQLRAFLRGQDFLIEVADDGPGIDWVRVAERAAERGLPCDTEEDLERALFSDGISTAREVTEISGRGVGMGALAHAARALGGSLEVESSLGQGTRVRFVFPASTMSPSFRELGRPSMPPAAA